MGDVTDALARFTAALSLDAVPPAVGARAQRLVLDAAAIAVRARADGESTAALLAGLAAAGLAPGSCGLFGTAETCAPAAAAGINAALVHTLDFDDTHMGASVHVGAPVVPAGLAAAQAAGADGRVAVAAVVAGMEVMIRLARALDPPRHYARGYHPTATTGVFGAAAAAARALGLDAGQTAAAFGIALSSAAGTLQFHANGAWTKRLQVGLAAEAGVRAAFLARYGFTGAADAVEGARGLLAVFSDGAEPARATAGLGSVWETLSIGVKPYPACRFAHAAIDGLLDLRREMGLDAVEAARIAFVEVGLSRKALAAVAEPEARKRRARNVVDAQFSIYFLTAAALLTGGVRWDDYPRLIGDAAVNALAARVRPLQDETVEALYPAAMAGRVTIVLDDGRRLTRHVPEPSGEPGCFPSDAALRDKAIALAGPVLGEAGAGALCAAALDLAGVGPDALFGAAAAVLEQPAFIRTRLSCSNYME